MERRRQVVADHERITRALAADHHVGSVVVIEVKGEIEMKAKGSSAILVADGVKRGDFLFCRDERSQHSLPTASWT
jgi:hypothetical protein